MSNLVADRELEKILARKMDLADYIAAAADSLIIDLFHKALKTIQKADNDFVTELDKAIESMALKNVMQSFPSDNFSGEENAGKTGQGNFEWVIDPIDGTDNFVRGLPLCGFQLAILYENEPIYSVLTRPFTQEVFSARKGHGAFYKNRLTGEESRLKVSDKPLSSALAIFDPRVGQSDSLASGLFASLAPRVATVRIFGAAIFDISAVASGGAEILVTGIATKHDVAPGWLLLSEAGGEIYNRMGETPKLSDKLMVLSNPVVKPAVLQLLKGVTNGN